MVKLELWVHRKASAMKLMPPLRLEFRLETTKSVARRRIEWALPLAFNVGQCPGATCTRESVLSVLIRDLLILLLFFSLSLQVCCKRSVWSSWSTEQGQWDGWWDQGLGATQAERDHLHRRRPNWSLLLWNQRGEWWHCACLWNLFVLPKGSSRHRMLTHMQEGLLSSYWEGKREKRGPECLHWSLNGDGTDQKGPQNAAVVVSHRQGWGETKEIDYCPTLGQRSQEWKILPPTKMDEFCDRLPSAVSIHFCLEHTKSRSEILIKSKMNDRSCCPVIGNFCTRQLVLRWANKSRVNSKEVGLKFPTFQWRGGWLGNYERSLAGHSRVIAKAASRWCDDSSRLSLRLLVPLFLTWASSACRPGLND